METDVDEIQQQAAISSDIASTDEYADNLPVNDPDLSKASVQPVAASVDEKTEQLASHQQGTQKPQNDVVGHKDATAKASRYVYHDETSPCQTDVVISKQEAKAADADDPASECGSDSASESFITCAPSSPAGTDSVFGSPHLDMAHSKNVSPPIQQEDQPSLGDTEIPASETKAAVYSQSESISATERRETVSDGSQSMLNTEDKADEGVDGHHSGNNQSEKVVENSATQDRDNDNTVDDFEDDEHDSEEKADEMQDQGAAGERMVVEQPENENEVITAAEPNKKSKKKKKKKNRQQTKQTQSAEDTKSMSSSTVKNKTDNAESRGPAAIQSTDTKIGDATDTKSAGNDSSPDNRRVVVGSGAVGTVGCTGDADNQHRSQRGSAAEQNDTKVCTYSKI